MALILYLLLAASTQMVQSSKSASPPPQQQYGPPALPSYTPAPYISPHGLSYAVTPAAPYGYAPYQQQQQPAAAAPPKQYGGSSDGQYPPACSKNTTKPWCLADHEYPTYDIQHAIEYHYAAVASLYKDVITNTDNSVDRLKYASEETYLCPSLSAYEMPLRAVNTEGKWRIVVNQVKAHYETLSQTVRLEECASPGHKCPLVPDCYDTKCLQKFAYHRFLTYDPYESYFPFAMESFKLPSACACLSGTASYQHK